MRRFAFPVLLPLFAVFAQPVQSQTTLPRQLRAAAGRISVEQLTHDIEYLEHGVPTLEFWTSLEWRYHRSADDARYLDMNKVGEVSRTVMAVAWEIANAPQRPMVDKGFPSRVPLR